MPDKPKPLTVDSLREAMEQMRKLAGDEPMFIRPTYRIVPAKYAACATCAHPITDHQRNDELGCARHDCSCAGWVTP